MSSSGHTVVFDWTGLNGSLCCHAPERPEVVFFFTLISGIKVFASIEGELRAKGRGREFLMPLCANRLSLASRNALLCVPMARVCDECTGTQEDVHR